MATRSTAPTVRKRLAGATVPVRTIARARLLLEEKGASAAAMEIGVTRETLLSAVAGQGIRNGSVALFVLWAEKAEKRPVMP